MPAGRLIPCPLDRLKQRGVGQQPIQRGEICRQLPNLDRQPEIDQRLHLPTRQPKHPPSKSPDLQGNHLAQSGQNRPPDADYFRGK
jgi:hypothetical protein